MDIVSPSESDMLAVICSWIDTTNRRIMEEAVRSNKTEIPDTGWKVVGFEANSIIVMRRNDGKRFRIIVRDEDPDERRGDTKEEIPERMNFGRRMRTPVHVAVVRDKKFPFGKE